MQGSSDELGDIQEKGANSPFFALISIKNMQKIVMLLDPAPHSSRTMGSTVCATVQKWRRIASLKTSGGYDQRARTDLSLSQFESDDELMRGVAQGDEEAIAELYDRFGRLVYRLAHQMTPSRADAEDAVQDIFVRLWRTAGKYDVQRAALSTWIVLLSRRYLVDRLRRSKTRVKSKVMFEEKWMATRDDESTSTDRIITDERYETLMEKIEQLPDLQQRVVKRAYLGGQTLRQIGIELDRPLGTIKSTLSRALVRLREKVGEESMT